MQVIEQHGTISTADLVAKLDLHENTVRGHLEQLHAAGRIRRTPERLPGRGRPRMLWHAVPTELSDPYAGLAMALADALAQTGPQAEQLARVAGRIWGTQLANSHSEIGDARELLMSVMSELDFDPEEAGADLRLQRCSMLSERSQRAPVVCAAHAGMLEGLAAARVGTPAPQLLPFAPSGGCLVQLGIPTQVP